MNDHQTLSVFTPSNTSPEDLEFILVQRENLIQDAVERIKESALSDHKHHLLFVGPRGCGKTFFLTLVIHRIGQDKSVADRLRIAWLNEDETCTTLLEFLIKTHAALEKRYPDEFRSDALDPAYEMKPDDASDFVAKHLLSTLGSRTLMVAVENLDAFFENLGPQGQKRLRSFIQENPRFCFVATAQRLVESLANRNNPFYGFFQTEHLKPLNVDQAVELLEKIARLDGKHEVVEFLASSRGRSRVRALHHLSGGNHRIYIVLSRFVTKENIDALVGPFMKMVDELTPYYQERVRWLAPLQRKIMEYLCACETTVPVKEISKRLFSSQQTISSQLLSLREKGYVESNQRGRESLYEVSEPLMRICVEVKENQRNKPLRLLVDFLRVWYDDDELTTRMDLPTCAASARLYLSAALERNKSEGSLRKKLLLKDLIRTLPPSSDSIELEQIIVRCETLNEPLLMALRSWAEGRPEESATLLNDEISHATDPDIKAELMLDAVLFFQVTANTAQENEMYTKLFSLSGASAHVVAAFLAATDMHWKEGKWDEGYATLEMSLKKGLQEMPASLRAVVLVLRTVFDAGLTMDSRCEKISRMVSIYRNHLALQYLGEGLVKHLGQMIRAGAPFPSSDNLRQWFAAWEQTAGDLDEFRLPLRLLRVGIDFVISGGKDQGILLTLTSPEREILNQALGLSEAS
jgi:DNA-binding transcriptional ArsR family regulator